LRVQMDKAKSNVAAAQALYNVQSTTTAVNEEAVQKAWADLAEQQSLLMRLTTELADGRASMQAEVKAEAEAKQREAQAKERELQEALRKLEAQQAAMRAEAEAKEREAEAKLRELQETLRNLEAQQAELRAEAEAKEREAGAKEREAEAKEREAEAKQREAEAREERLQATVRRLEWSLEGRGKEVSRAEAREREARTRERNLAALLEDQGQALAEASRAAAEEERVRGAAAAARSDLLLAMLKVVGDRAQNATGGEPIPDLAEQREAALEGARANAQRVTELEAETELARAELEEMRASLETERRADRGAALVEARARAKFLDRALTSIASESGAFGAGNLFGLLKRRSNDEVVQDILERVDKLKAR